MQKGVSQTQPVEFESQPTKPWLKVVGFSVGGLVLVGGLVWAGIQVGKGQARRDTQYAIRLTPATSPVATSQPTFSPLPPEAPAKESDGTTEWKSYANKDLGFMIKLPPNWNRSNRLLVKLNSVVIEKFTPLSEDEVSKMLQDRPYSPNYYFEVDVRDNPNNISPREWATKGEYSPQGADQIVSEVILNNNPAVKVVGNQGLGYIDYFLHQGGKIYNLGYYYRDEDPTWGVPPLGISEDLFNLILSTFRFLE